MVKAKVAPNGAAMLVADRAELLRAATVASIVQTKETIPVLANMVIEGTADEIAMSATDLDILVRVTVPGRCEGAPFATTIAAKRFAGLIGSADEGCQVSLKMDAGGRDVWLNAPRMRCKMPMLPVEDFPMIAFNGGQISFTLPAKLLAAVLARTADAESSEQTRYYLCGTLLAVADGRLVAVATNGHMAAEIDLGEAPGEWPNCIVPSKLTGLLARLLKDGDGDVDITLDQKGQRIRFEWDAWTITGKLIDGTFPDWRRVIPAAKPERRLVIDSGGLSRAIARVSQMSGEKTRSVLVELGAEGVTVSCSSPEYGAAEEDVPASWSGEPFRIRVNATYLRSIANAASADSVAFDFGGERDPVRIEPQAGAGFVGVLMPMAL